MFGLFLFDSRTLDLVTFAPCLAAALGLQRAVRGTTRARSGSTTRAALTAAGAVWAAGGAVPGQTPSPHMPPRGIRIP